MAKKEKLPPGLMKQYGIKNRTQLNTLIYKKSKQINQRFYRLEKKNAGLNEAAYHFAKKETGMEKPRYTVNKDKIKAMNVSEAYEQLLKIDKKLKSDTSTFRGLKKVGQRRLEATFKSLKEEHYELSGISELQWKQFLESGGGELLNKYMDSKQLIEDWVDNLKKGVTTGQFIKTYNKFLDDTNAPFDLGKVDRALEQQGKENALESFNKLMDAMVEVGTGDNALGELLDAMEQYAADVEAGKPVEQMIADLEEHARLYRDTAKMVQAGQESLRSQRKKKGRKKE